VASCLRPRDRVGGSIDPSPTRAQYNLIWNWYVFRADTSYKRTTDGFWQPLSFKRYCL